MARIVNRVAKVESDRTVGDEYTEIDGGSRENDLEEE